MLKKKNPVFSTKFQKFWLEISPSWYIVIEIKNIFRMPSINGNEFYNLQTFKFWVIFILWCQILRHFNAISPIIFITLIGNWLIETVRNMVCVWYMVNSPYTLHTLNNPRCSMAIHSEYMSKFVHVALLIHRQ